METIVIGGGASGLVCAIAAARLGKTVRILERMERIGSKLLATGNGRCNLMNAGQPLYPAGQAFADRVLAAYGADRQLDFWHSLGLRTREEEAGRVYPACAQASAVLDVLRFEIERLGIRVDTNTAVTDILPQKRGFTVLAGSKRYQAERVVLCGGGCAQPKLGSNGSLIRLARSMGYPTEQPQPVLTQAVTDKEPIIGLSGIRVKAIAQVMAGDACLYEEHGEVLFTDYGISGVCTMNCSSYLQPGMTVRLNLLPGLGFSTADALRAELMRRTADWPNESVQHLLTGLCVPRLAQALLKAAEISANRMIGQLQPKAVDHLVRVITAFDLCVQSLRGFDYAQVTRGGLLTESFDPGTMESRLHRGLYACGEVLNVDGLCGGHNLMFACASGLCAGTAIGQTGGEQ